MFFIHYYYLKQDNKKKISLISFIFAEENSLVVFDYQTAMKNSDCADSEL